MHKTTAFHKNDAYLSTCEGKVIAINDSGGVILDQTCFYATSGGQPGDTGFLERKDGSKITVTATVHGETKEEIIHLLNDAATRPEIGEKLVLHIDWQRRYKLMRMHTACHLLTVLCPFPITGASVGEEESRVDFDMNETVNKIDITQRMQALVDENHPIFVKWFPEQELSDNPSLIKSKNVRPPSGMGDVRLVCIGKDANIDSQPCGGTHVSETQEVGKIHIGKIEKKGKQNRRFRIRFGELPKQ